MAQVRTRTPQQRDARELARTRPSDPYRGVLSDPFTPRTVQPARPTRPQQPTRPSVASQPGPSGLGERSEPTQLTAFDQRPAGGQPGAATLAGILGIVLGLALGIFGLLLVTLVSLENQDGAPDRSFYRGTDSGYVVLALIDFALAGLCAIGAIVLFTGRVTGRIAMTIGGWACLVLATFWLVDSSVRWEIPVAVALVAAAMLWAVYVRSVTRWLGILPAPQPE